jgi:hypothetical protein
MPTETCNGNCLRKAFWRLCRCSINWLHGLFWIFKHCLCIVIVLKPWADFFTSTPPSHNQIKTAPTWNSCMEVSLFLQYSYKCVHVKKLTWGNHRTTALSLAGKGRVVAEKRATRRSMKIPFPPCLNAVYFPISDTIIITHWGSGTRRLNVGKSPPWTQSWDSSKGGTCGKQTACHSYQPTSFHKKG